MKNPFSKPTAYLSLFGLLISGCEPHYSSFRSKIDKDSVTVHYQTTKKFWESETFPGFVIKDNSPKDTMWVQITYIKDYHSAIVKDTANKNVRFVFEDYR